MRVEGFGFCVMGQMRHEKSKSEGRVVGFGFCVLGQIRHEKSRSERS